MKNIPTIFLKDFYKVGHIDQYPPGTSLVFNNFTPRKSMLAGVNGSVFFGLKYFIEKYLRDGFKEITPEYLYPENDPVNAEDSFFVTKYHEIMDNCLGRSDKGIGQHLNYLIHYINKNKKLPIEIYALPEGTFVPCGVPALVMYNTDSAFFWLPNMLETVLSCTLWGPCTSATIAREYRRILDEYAATTSDNLDFVRWQAHDFSMRGMYGVEAASLSAAAHLLYFSGTDSIPGIMLQDQYYGKPINESGSIPATEHSVMCAYGKENELWTYKRLINEIYPSGIVSIVSDTWDLWHVITHILPELKDDIMKRDGKVVIRPDSGDPVAILCGDSENCITQPDYTLSFGVPHPSPIINVSKQKGVVQLLWEIFGGTINSKGYKQLDPHIGVIYGDSITLDRAKEICEILKNKGFASTNVVFGIGSYTYQYNTRDTLGWAMKTTYIEIDGKGREIYKDPITDDGTKKSHKGLLKVIKDCYGKLICQQGITWDEFHASNNELKRVY